ncbi:GlxA family transcriptional regulator [Amaricoccus solimangrovi]|uniref:Helix-turn-helix domain-containing protein n=1 Tax=Amaricoccus solimangrovi TaxID=2589815 RepID=A0A501WQV5_9RHOB|nr:DJ-1/PfpI family protein [Amaricoccus solimangrovi]TPE48166.1 helix-turn-helix domain-containing protein [Amaricoccus solimangrovi]
MGRTVAIVIHPGFQLLDAAGPMAAFELAARFAPGSYALRMVAPAAGRAGGVVASSAGADMVARPLPGAPPDTVIVAGGEIVRVPAAAGEIVDWLRRTRARRIASVCSGAFLLAAAGLLDGRRATTHWDSAEDLARRHPEVRVEPDRIFVRDGDTWTSAGITAGIDLALALVEDDLGAALARRVARQLVLHQRRAGGQTQFSALLDIGGATGRFGPLIDWIRAHLGERLTVERLAAEAAMSPRNFARAFGAETGSTPAKAVERLRLEAARTAVETSLRPLEEIARVHGFTDAGHMRRAFLRALGQPPLALRRAARG